MWINRQSANKNIMWSIQSYIHCQLYLLGFVLFTNYVFESIYAVPLIHSGRYVN